MAFSLTQLGVLNMKRNVEGTLTFNLDTLEGRRSLENAVKADLMREKIDAIYDEVFRSPIKYGNIGRVSLTEEQIEALELVLSSLSDHFEDCL